MFMVLKSVSFFSHDYGKISVIFHNHDKFFIVFIYGAFVEKADHSGDFSFFKKIQDRRTDRFYKFCVLLLSNL